MVLGKVMKIRLLMLVLTVLAVTWSIARFATTRLEAQRLTAFYENEQLELLLRERARLQQRLGDVSNTTAHSHLAARPEPVATDTAPIDESIPSVLEPGEWRSPSDWRDRGRRTPNATVETLFWAAAGGDAGRLVDILELDDSAQLKAEALLAGLPEPARATYPSPKHLVAAFTIRAIPLNDAQLVWQHQSGADEAVACMFMRNTEPPPSTSAIQADLSAEKVPPMTPPNEKVRLAYLSLRRSADGWRFVVPVSAIDKIASDLDLDLPEPD